MGCDIGILQIRAFITHDVLSCYCCHQPPCGGTAYLWLSKLYATSDECCDENLPGMPHETCRLALIDAGTDAPILSPSLAPTNDGGSANTPSPTGDEDDAADGVVSLFVLPHVYSNLSLFFLPK